MIEKILRAPLPDQLKALLEKLDSDPDASSIFKINEYVRLYARYLTRYERMVFRRSINQMNRKLLMEEAMAIVINQPVPETYTYKSDKGYVINTNTGRVLTAEEIQRDTMRILSKHFDKAYAEHESDLGRANSGLYAAQAKAEGARVNY